MSLVLGDRGRTLTHSEVAVGTRVVVSSNKGTWDIMECWKHSLPTPQQYFAAVGHISLGNDTGGFVRVQVLGDQWDRTWSSQNPECYGKDRDTAWPWGSGASAP